ncbi:3-hydroxyacyl-CoA dehydrogenase / enoyl-CoA hydratase / 3-hydroxybutyryl-CoA epimerase [Lutimaribacter pacificus]|uniref:enoyl-CoA hydratase n=1 Tax=Lutimaribacter pacificus TaxID=391948 RepID=A0A1H0M4V2_9RHOB|nr:3-hydroxyacyl-CoA dehydrogenase NAD-binding domain-containing protein [Lutimaribacter pacificus]SDO75407.1 3-hydroxyacyl-CoA dehydrogenase / enoyl-CoA hydratase / 3-hydroxybutyryl-CoA epimerase [Lutimaribacter pacificus]SHK77766.1 3-hydroxyacyl-CoA dehydrogenase / enoyl-CoA hydratase / 3-hydroxybutyryl-CoA epimerase [Lutimaribacter pacificus]
MGVVLDHLGETRLELGAARNAERKGNWRMGRDGDGIAWLALDKPDTGTNTVSVGALRELDGVLGALEADLPAALVIRSAKTGGFAAGAEIGELADLAGQDAGALLREGHRVLDRLEALECPTVAVVHGAALGAGFELALACDRRIAVEGASFGFPEVHLGLHPGLGGTFRLTGLIAPDAAMTLMLTGKTAHTAKALSLGIADEVTEERHVAAAVRAAVTDADARGHRLKAMAFGMAPARSLAARQMRAGTAEKVREDHYPAPYRLIDLWEEHGGDREAMQAAEIASFAALLDSATSRNLIRAFFLRQGLKSAGPGDSDIAWVHVVGAGEMGAGIAAWAAIRGCRVTLSDPDTAALGHAVRRAGRICKDRHLGTAGTRDALDRLMPDPNGYGIAQADLVIEAGPEDAGIKRGIYDMLGKRMKPGAILASNTSSLRLADLAQGVIGPERFAGLHFFNPVEKMELIEVIRQDRTGDQTIDRLAAFCREIGRLPARVADTPGFLVNRALIPYLMEALVLMEEGVPKDRIDRAALDFGMPAGPVTLADQVGLDICLDVAESLSGQLEKPFPDIPRALRDRVAAGETGKKAGKGFYDWSDGPPEPAPAEDDGSSDMPDDLTDRLILPICDACVTCLRQQVARSEDEIDAAMIFATGFAPFRGGPMRYARDRGPEEVRARLAALADAHGPRFAPDEGWAQIG